MAPPFNVVSSEITSVVAGAAFAPNGVGFCTIGSRVLSFPTGSKVVKLSSPTEAIAYVP